MGIIRRQQMREGARLLSERITVSNLVLIVSFLFSALFIAPVIVTRAAANLTITPITWNVVGLNAVNVNQGPNQFPVGARVCNTGDTAAANIVTSFVWDTSDPVYFNPYISVSGPVSQTLSTLPASGCADFYFNVLISRNAGALDTSRIYALTTTAAGLGTISTTTYREIYVAPLTPVSNLTTTSITGPTSVSVGRFYPIVVTETTSGTGYQQVEHFLNLPNSVLGLTSVSSTFTTPSGVTHDKLYADACGWSNDPFTSTYRTCIGPAPFTGGVVSGTLVTTYTVQVLQPGTVTLVNALYGYTNGAYHLASDSGADSLAINATQPLPSIYLPIVLRNSRLRRVVATPTPTRTPTASGTPATPTSTGTITPNPGATKTITPGEARIGQNFTFSIRITNNGSAPATNVIFTDTLASYNYLDIANLTTSKGTRNISGRVATANVGTVNPGEVVDVVLTVRVNNNATGTQTPCNTAQIRFTGGTRNSNQQCFRVIGGSTLPGTGEISLEEAAWLSMRKSLLTLFLILFPMGLLAFWLGGRAMRHSATGFRRYFAAGAILIAAALITGCGLLNLGGTPEGESQIDVFFTEVPLSTPTATPSETINPLAYMPTYLFATPVAAVEAQETLPSFPIPAPTIQSTPEAGETGPDTSAIERIVIPSINVDNPVAYVPFDGRTWLIRGLKQEVAWMGDTSWPGLGGNTGLAGHVTLRGIGNGPFRYLADLTLGDVITLETELNRYTYHVREKRTVEETDMTVVSQTETAQITLITCIDWDTTLEYYLHRVIVVAELVKVEPLPNVQSSK